jgi:hypothetical protein
MTKHTYRIAQLSNGARIFFKDGQREPKLGFYSTLSRARRVVHAIELYERFTWNVQCDRDVGIYDSYDASRIQGLRKAVKIAIKANQK